MDRGRQELVKRYRRNPIITRDDIPVPCSTVFNAGTARHKDEYMLLLRVEALEGRVCGVLMMEEGRGSELGGYGVSRQARPW